MSSGERLAHACGAPGHSRLGRATLELRYGDSLKGSRFQIDLFRRTPSQPEIYQDYLAPIVADVDREITSLLAGFGFWPRALQKANIERAKEAGRKPPLMRSTMTVRDENLGKSPLSGPAWRAGRRCLILWPTGSTNRATRPGRIFGTASAWRVGGRCASPAFGEHYGILMDRKCR